MTKFVTEDDWLASFYKSKPVRQILSGHPLITNPSPKTDFTLDLRIWDCIELLLKKGKQPSNGWYRRLAYWIKYEVSPDLWENNIHDILEKTNNGGSLTSSSYTDLKLAYGAKEGKKRWNKYRERQAETNTFEYKKEKYGWSKEEFDDYNKSRSMTLNHCIERHGEENGLKLWHDYCERQAYTNTLEYFIEREGSKEKGLEVFLNYNQEKARSQDPNWIMEKYNVTFNEALEILANRRTSSFISEGEKYFVDELEEILGDQIKYTYKTRQFCVWSNELKAPLFYDIVCSKRMKAIEYNGDYWHANPNLYEADYYVKKVKKSAKEIWERDQIKLNCLLERGFEVKVVWESDFLKNEEMLKEIIEWWKK